jgi:hypothetical protein
MIHHRVSKMLIQSFKMYKLSRWHSDTFLCQKEPYGEKIFIRTILSHDSPIGDLRLLNVFIECYYVVKN